MTTIVYDHEKRMIAADGRETDQNGLIMCDHVEKIHHCPNGDVLGCCGDVAAITVLIEHWGTASLKAALMEVTSEDDRCTVIFYEKETDQFGMYSAHCNDMGVFHTYKQYLTYSTAIGSGSEFAIAAMDFGCSAQGAIEYASTRDSNTGEKVSAWKQG